MEKRGNIMTLNINFAKNKGLTVVTPAPSFSTIGALGTAGQMAAGHVLTQSSFPTAAYANTSFYNLTSDSTTNDINTSLGHNLTNNGTAVFNGTGILGLANSCVSLNGTAQYLSSTDAHFDPGDADFAFGGWFKPTSWKPASQYSFVSQYDTPSKASFYVYLDSNGYIYVAGYTTGVTIINAIIKDVSTFSGFHHIAVRYTATLNLFELFIDGKNAASGSLGGNIQQVGANRKFNIGSYSNTGTLCYPGLIDEFFFCNGTAFTDNDIAKIFAAKYSHSLNVPSLQQKWVIQGYNGGQTRELFDNIIDMQPNDLYYDLSDEASTTQVSLRLANIY